MAELDKSKAVELLNRIWRPNWPAWFDTRTIRYWSSVSTASLSSPGCASRPLSRSPTRSRPER